MTSKLSKKVDAKITTKGLANFKGCKNLISLYLSGPEIDDARLANFKDCKDLRKLVLQGCKRVNDAALIHFPGLQKPE